MRILTLQRLEIFKTISATNSISEAARRLNLAQPTVSRHIRDFEAALKLGLFINESGRIKPTWEAHRLFEICEGTYERLRQVENAIAGIREGRGQTIRLMSVPSFFSFPFLAAALKRVIEEYPEIDVSMDVGSSANQIQSLREGNIDIGLAAEIPETPDLKISTIGHTKIVMIVSKNHPMADKEVFPISAVEKYPCIMPFTRAPVGKFIDQELAKHGISMKRLMTAVSPAIAPRLVEALGCCAISDSLTAVANPHIDIKAIPLSIDISVRVQAIQNAAAAKRTVDDLYIHSLRDSLSMLSNKP
ncbi:LysR family transcriptional regulator [Sneathiella sp.]|uniref:LysR family transcriptional regulator n=1 Tax=Sneathiella sp. TaxID=1964365 RepID=UPI0026346C31|nr:LysR family transcriptional regulator [Sneathiella sp.]MDF2368435.1 LysR family transcriptional regulator [Sneathiella sp.]